MTDPVAQAVRRSVLSNLQPETMDKLLGNAMRVDLPAGSLLYREGDPPRCGLLVSGLVRVFLADPAGHQVTIRYMRPGSLSGSSVVVLGRSADVRVQAVTACVGLLLNVSDLRRLAQADARVAWALATDVARSQEEIMAAFATSVFGTVRQRLARHLLDLAAAQFGVSLPLVAPVTQQELADAVGSAREVVTRVLRELRDAGLVDTSRGGVLLLDPERLHAEVEPDLPL